MSTRVNGSAQMNAACRELLRQQLNIPLDATVELESMSTMLSGGRVEIPALREMLGSQTVSVALGRLAPGAFGHARDLLGAAPSVALGSVRLAESAQMALADAVATASAAIVGAARDVTVDAFSSAGAELGYTVSAWRGSAVTGVVLRRPHEVILLRIHDGGAIESDHAGLADARCGSRQRELELAVQRRGVTLTNRRELEHGQAAGGDLIRLAASRPEPDLARATVAAAEQPAERVVTRRLFDSGRAGDAVPASRRTRAAQRGGAA
jgi:hypothetical protein